MSIHVVDFIYFDRDDCLLKRTQIFCQTEEQQKEKELEIMHDYKDSLLIMQLGELVGAQE